MKSTVALCLLVALSTASCGVLPAATTLLRTIPSAPLVRSHPLGHSFSYSTVEYAPAAAVTTYQAAATPLYTSPIFQQHLQLLQQFSPVYQSPGFGGNPILAQNPVLQNPILQNPIFGGQQPVADAPAGQPPAPAQTPVAGTPLDEDTVAVDAAI